VEPFGPLQACNGTALPFYSTHRWNTRTAKYSAVPRHNKSITGLYILITRSNGTLSGFGHWVAYRAIVMPRWWHDVGHDTLGYAITKERYNGHFYQ